MVYLFALIGAVTVGVVLWRLLGAGQSQVETPPKRAVAPDDDPDFLRDLGRRTRRHDSDGPETGS
ncbi:MAG: hypothetical protein JOZ47_08410 [Kutzneria sp.]|nr:hypothetical protein [Kutzneria sp.]